MNDVTSTYIQGTQSNLSSEYPLNWDQIHIIFSNSTQNPTNTEFSISFPITYRTETEFHFELMVGIYNTETRLITYLNTGPKPIDPSATFKKFLSTPAVSSKPKQTNTKIQLTGKTGSYKDNVELTI